MVDLAAYDGARGLILESTFSSLPDVAASIYPFFPVRWLMRSRLDSAEKIEQYDGPILQSHGNADTIIPFELGRRLFERANAPKTWFTAEGLNHNDPQPRDYTPVLSEFFGNL